VDTKAAAASVLCLVAMLFVILLSAGGNDTIFLFGVLATGLASAAFAVGAVVGGLASRKPSENRQFSVLIGLVILGVFAFVVFALIAAFGDSFE